MLYKKIHRQYLRQFQEGRELKYECCGCNKVYKITKKLYIDDENYITIDCVEKDDEGNESERTFTFSLISIASCQFLYKDKITFLD